MNRLKYLLGQLWANVMVRRTVHTFWQAFASVFLVGIPLVITALHTHGIDSGKKALISLISAAIAAGLAALRTGFMNVYEARKGA